MITIVTHIESNFAALCNYLPKFIMLQSFCLCLYIYIYLYIYINVYKNTTKKIEALWFWKDDYIEQQIGFKMGDYCYHMLDGVPLNIYICVPNHWPKSALWTIHMISNQNRGVKTPCSILFVIFQRVGLHIYVLTIHKLQNAKDDNFLHLLGKSLWIFNY